MPTRIRTRLVREAEQANREQLVRLGDEARQARHRRRMTQAQLGARVGLSQSAMSRLERGGGGGMTLDALQRVAVALEVTLRVGFQRDPLGETADAGHLAMQELVLRLGRAAGYTGSFELATKPAEPWRSADVGLADGAHRRLIHVECWNTIGDIGAAARSSARKQAELADLAIARWGTDATTGLVWVVRATARNRSLVARYPEVFGSRFPGSSRGWVDALTTGEPPPDRIRPRLERRRRNTLIRLATPPGARLSRWTTPTTSRLIRGGVAGAGPQWLELGAGQGAFTLALADVLGPGGEHPGDGSRCPSAGGGDPKRSGIAFRRRSWRPEPSTSRTGSRPGRSTACSRRTASTSSRTAIRRSGPIRVSIRPGGRLVVVEYDADRGNPWVPHPFSFATWRREAQAAGFEEPAPDRPCPEPVPRGDLRAPWQSVPSALVDSAPHGDDREE